MGRNHACRKCGAEVPGSELEGLCPGCVARAAFVGEAELEAVPLRDLTSTGLRFFGDYELLEEIARGGMGVVYKARQISLNREVAVKMILAGQLASPADIQRFLAEAEAAANLQHPNIVAIHEVGQLEGQHYFSMDYVEGKNLAQLGSESQVADAEWRRRAATYVRAIAEAIEYAHQRGILHRDLKPSNILIDAFDRPRITDFGLAKRVKRDSDLTVSGQIIGSPNFMPPEQAAGRRAQIGPQSDVYSLGALLYFLLTGKPPFEGDTVHDTLTKVLNSDPAWPRARNPAIPTDLETICLKCLEKSAARRYASAQALADDLDRFLNSEPVTARPISPLVKFWRTAQRHRVPSSLVLTVTALLVIVVLVAQRRSSSAASHIGEPDSRPVPDMPAPSGQGISAMINGKFYVTSATAGLSHDYPKSLFVYDPQANRWQRLADSHVAHSTPAGAAIGGKLYLTGGRDGTNGLTGILEVFDPASGKWELKKPMPGPRLVCSGVALNGKFFVIGGFDGTNVVSTVEAYDPATDMWSSQPGLHTPRAGFGAAVINDTIFVASGMTNTLAGCTDEVETWKPGATNWITLPIEETSRMADPVNQPFAAALWDVLYIFGGTTESGAVDRAQCLVRGDRGWIWLPQTKMPAIRYMGCGALAYRDEIWLFGGWTMHPDREAFPHPEVFIFSPKGNSWRAPKRRNG